MSRRFARDSHNLMTTLSNISKDQTRGAAAVAIETLSEIHNGNGRGHEIISGDYDFDSPERSPNGSQGYQYPRYPRTASEDIPRDPRRDSQTGYTPPLDRPAAVRGTPQRKRKLEAEALLAQKRKRASTTQLANSPSSSSSVSQIPTPVITRTPEASPRAPIEISADCEEKDSIPIGEVSSQRNSLAESSILADESAELVPPSTAKPPSDMAVAGDVSSTSPALPTLSASEGSFYQIFYRIICDSALPSEYHNGMIFKDKPGRGVDGQNHHLSGVMAVFDVDDEYINYDFVITRDLYCAGDPKLRVEEDLPHEPSHAHQPSTYRHESLCIVSDRLRWAVETVAKCYMPLYRGEYGGREMEMRAPYMYFYHHRSELSAFAEDNAHVADVLKALLDYLESNFGKEYADADTLKAHGQINSRHILTLFVPNQILLTRLSTDPYHEPCLRAMVLKLWPPVRESSLNLDCWHFTLDGLRLRRRGTSQFCRIPRYGTVDIKDLDVFPLEYATERELQYLEERGRRYWGLRDASYVSYTGLDVPGETMHTNGRMMVDYQTFRQIQPNADAFRFDEGRRPGRDPYDQYEGRSDLYPMPFDEWPNTLYLSARLRPDEPLLMPASVHAFNLSEKKWQHIWLDGIKHIEWNKTAFDRLVLQPKVKDLVKSLVLVRKSGTGANLGASLACQRKDVIRGKGNGLIMLLHGGPGTGKTLTAESVAEVAEMPLYSVTCGDLGTRPETVERYLEAHFFLTKTWNCVLLLDDADVFLEERSLSDLGRNSLVAIFLRMLEYYEGILILTSNRIGTFDEAFKSRIQVALHYPKLDTRSRRSIWSNFLEMLEEDNADADHGGLRSRLVEVAEFEINGRQIRNVLTTARQLALYKKETLCWEHLEVSIKTVTDFNLYTRSLQGHTDEQWAREEKLR